MKITFAAIIALATWATFTVSSHGQPVKDIIDAMRSGNYSQCYDRYAFPKLSTNDIPQLLTYAGNKNILTNFPVNGFSSLGRMRCSEGMMVLWLIEGIRIGGEYPSLIPACYDTNKTVQAGAVFYTEADQDDVSKAYLSWWKKTAGRIKDIGPLDGTSLTWGGGRTPDAWKK